MYNIFRLQIGEKVIFGTNDFSYNKICLYFKFKPIYFKWLTDFKELTLMLPFGFNITKAKSNYRGHFTLAAYFMGLECKIAFN